MTRDRLISAADEIFRERGYVNASIVEISEAGGVGRATFYLHFSSKVDIFLALLDELQATGFASADDLNAVLQNPSRVTIAVWIREALSWWEQSAPLLLAFQAALATEWEAALRWKQYLDEFTNRLTGFIETYPAEQQTAIKLQVELLMVQLHQACFLTMAQPVFDTGRDELVEALTDIWCGTFRISN